MKAASFLAASMFLLSACAGPAARPPAPPAPPAPALYRTSFPCDAGNSASQDLVCHDAGLAGLDRDMADELRRILRDGDLFARDQALAAQRAWLIGLPQRCSADVACLAESYRGRIAALRARPPARAGGVEAVAHYVRYKVLDDREPALCQALLAASPSLIGADGALDPGRWAGSREIAGSHGPERGDGVIVDLYVAGLYGGYQIRARSLSLGAEPVLGPSSLGDYAGSLPNRAGRFGSFASQTGDYGAIDAFARDGRMLALVTDPVGYFAPASSGEAALAGLFTLDGGKAGPACLFQTYLRPAYHGSTEEQPSLTPLLTLIDTVGGTPPEQMAPSDRLDSRMMAEQTRWTLLHMPLVALAQAKEGGWTGWLRHRHDEVLDALYGWSRRSADNKAIFDRLMALLRPAALDLGRIYREEQGLTRAEAEPAVGLAIMELLYQAALYLSPGLVAAPEDAAAYQGYKPRYATLPTPN
jgi:hypothetical protein